EHLPSEATLVAGHGDQGEIPAVQHDLQREQDDQRAPADEDADGARHEQDGGDDEVGGDVRASHPLSDPQCSRRADDPSTTPPTAATSRMIEVTSNASRWSVRNARPMAAGLPNDSETLACERLPLAFRPRATMISTSSTPAAAIAATVCQFGPPAQGASA